MTEHYKDYCLYDRTDDYGIVNYYDTLEEAKKAAEEWEIDTDGDCDLIILKWDYVLEAYFPIE